MRLMKFIFLFVFVAALATACKKEANSVQTVDMSAVTVVNAVVGSNPVLTDFSGITPVSTYYSSTQKIGYGSYKEFSMPSGATPFVAYQTTDTVNAVFKTDKGHELDLQPQGVYSLFLCGQATPSLQPDEVWVTDDLPYHPASDSSVGVRFINLSPGSSAVNVTLSSSATTNEFSNIAYKSISDFKNYPATAAVSSYTFQFRDAGTNAVLGSYTMSGINNGANNTSNNNWRFRNFTIVLKGLPGGSGGTAQGAFLVNNY